MLSRGSNRSCATSYQRRSWGRLILLTSSFSCIVLSIVVSEAAMDGANLLPPHGRFFSWMWYNGCSGPQAVADVSRVPCRREAFWHGIPHNNRRICPMPTTPRNNSSTSSAKIVCIQGPEPVATHDHGAMWLTAEDAMVRRSYCCSARITPRESAVVDIAPSDKLEGVASVSSRCRSGCGAW